MRKTISFCILDALLRDLGFEAHEAGSQHCGSLADKPRICYLRPGTTQILVFPRYAPADPVAAHHIAAVRTFLDFWGVLPRPEFDQKLGLCA